MNQYHKRRFITVFLFIICLSLAASLILFSLKKNLNVFLTPGQITAQQIESDYTFRVGGLVKKESVKREQNNLDVEFVMTDFKRDLVVRYHGILPDLFREGKGAIAEGRFQDGTFIATQILAKHDENYMPSNVANMLKDVK